APRPAIRSDAPPLSRLAPPGEYDSADYTSIWISAARSFASAAPSDSVRRAAAFPVGAARRIRQRGLYFDLD
ncbi:hypothetical protein C0U44_31960, partial [Klebsiella pneumoniae]